ncbi:MAG TPA: hypothetical protein VMR18_04545 [Candidatus Saccharimonadales bacterium]|nr:hypothetical protein [Candidatus Saccharimonadales bacterium]
MKREIEIKYLLKNELERNKLVANLQNKYPKLIHKGPQPIKSYYYENNPTKKQVLRAASVLLNEKERIEELENVINNSEEFVVRCRSLSDNVSFAVKGASAGKDPLHAENRLEFEAPLLKSLDEVNRIFQEAGLKIVSRWSGVRDSYSLDGTINAELEFMSGYGYKVELEILINDGESISSATEKLNELAKVLVLVKAKAGLLANMYEYYNANWQQYFDTSKVFNDKTWKTLGR